VAPIVSSRQQMADLLDERMNKTYAQLSSQQELETDTTLLKTYLVEAHGHDPRNGAASEPIARAFSEGILGDKVTTKASQSSDESLIIVEGSVKSERIILFLDVSDPRFWLVHSMASSVSLDWLFERIITTLPEIDQVWLPNSLLVKIAGMGTFKGLGLDYDRRAVQDVDFEGPDAPVEFLKMQLWGNRAAEVLDLFRFSESFKHYTTLSKVKIKFVSASTGQKEHFTIDDFKFNGKVTARGTSFQCHLTLVADIYRRYKAAVRQIEEKYALLWTFDNGNINLEGEPLVIAFEPQIANLEIFVEKLFSGTAPFRLWGVPTFLSKRFCKVSAVDLHVGQTLSFEVAPDFMRIYLPKGCCGNTILRIFTNLQHHYNSLVSASDSKGSRLLEF